MYTYNESGKSTTKKQTVNTKNPNIILPFNDPLRQCNTHGHILAAVGMSIFFEILTSGFIGEAIHDKVQNTNVNESTYDL